MSTEYRLLTEEVNGITRWLDVHPAWDKRSDIPSKNYGVHGLEFVFGVQIGKFAVTWRIMTNWMLPNVREDLAAQGLGRKYEFDGLGSLDYHSPVICYEGQEPVKGCSYTGGDCYGTSLGAGELWEQFVAQGPSAVWVKLEDWIRDTMQRAKQEETNRRNFS